MKDRGRPVDFDGEEGEGLGPEDPSPQSTTVDGLAVRVKKDQTVAWSATAECFQLGIQEPL
jgi:hypothetical protein